MNRVFNKDSLAIIEEDLQGYERNPVCTAISVCYCIVFDGKHVVAMYLIRFQ